MWINIRARPDNNDSIIVYLFVVYIVSFTPRSLPAVTSARLGWSLEISRGNICHVKRRSSFRKPQTWSFEASLCLAIVGIPNGKSISRCLPSILDMCFAKHTCILLFYKILNKYSIWVRKSIQCTSTWMLTLVLSSHHSLRIPRNNGVI